jgi:hypothetical protein
LIDLDVFKCDWTDLEQFSEINSRTKDECMRLLICALHSSIIVIPNIEETVHNFVYLLLFFFEYHGSEINRRLLPQSTPEGSNLNVGNNPNREGNADFFLVDLARQKVIILLIIENKSAKSGLSFIDVEGQLVAEAIIAYQTNMKNNVSIDGPLLLPAIIMIGSCPTFYLIHLKPELIKQAENWDQQVRKATYVERFKIPSLILPSKSIAFLKADKRLLISRCLVAFKNYIDETSIQYKQKLINHIK